MNNTFEKLKMLRILIVEDDIDTLTWLSSILKIYFSEILLAKDGSEGLFKYQKESPDLIITDIHMVGIDGLSMMRRIKQEKSTFPIIVTTAHNSDMLLPEIAVYENVIFLKKPVDIDEILIASNNFFPGQPTSDIYQYDKENYTVIIQDKPTHLTKNESALFELLHTKFPNVVTKEEIEQHVWQSEPPTSETLRMLVQSLRKKINPLKITNLKSIGYRLDEP